ncbi:NUDIX hydrolase [Marinobacterium arenosum]|uniref:NUDIX hydrolase n=1 Tax=Marinobacterium arenosum TaxID=2862496 RepID=UPI001C942F48|nr:NUDIX hydrolase [Marinobacterium arenosum]MBY4677867.1 NUDIX hydrolase [Marinobacterium arenosum]
MVWTPHATVATIVERDGRFLLIEERASGSIVLNQPAGHVEEGERFIDAAVRETLEESAWHVDPEYLVGLYIYQAPANGVTYHRMCFYAKAREHEPERPLDDGILRTHWLTRDEIAARSDSLRSPMVLRCIDDYLAGQRYPLDFIYEHQNEMSAAIE